MSILRLSTLLILSFTCVCMLNCLQKYESNTEGQTLEINLNISGGVTGDNCPNEYLNHKRRLTEPREGHPWFTRTTTRRRTGVSRPLFRTDLDEEITENKSPPSNRIGETTRAGNKTYTNRGWNISHFKSVALSVYHDAIQIITDVKCKIHDHFAIFGDNFRGLLIDCYDKVQTKKAVIAHKFLEAIEGSKKSAERAFRSFKDGLVEHIDNGIARVRLYFVPESPVERKCKGYSNWYAKSACTLLFQAAEYPPQLVSTLAEGYDSLFEVTIRLFVRETHKDKVCKGYDTVPFLRKVCETGFDVASKANEILENAQEFLSKCIAQPALDFTQKVIASITDCVWKVKEGFARACHNGMNLGNKITTYLYQGLDVEAAKALLYSVLKKAAYKVHDVYVRLPRFNGDPIHDGLVVVAWVVCAIAQGLVVYWARRKISLDNNVRKARQMRVRFSHPIPPEEYNDKIARLIREQEEEEDAECGEAALPDETESLQNVNVTSGITDNDDKDGANPVDDLGNDSGVWADLSLGRIEEEEEEAAPTVSAPSVIKEEPRAVKEKQSRLPSKLEDNAPLLDLKDGTAVEKKKVQIEDTQDEEQNASGTTYREALESSTDAAKDSEREMQKSASSAIIQEPQGRPEPDAASQMDKNNNETESDGSERLIEESKEPPMSCFPDVNTDEISEALKQTDSRDPPTPQPTEANHGGGGWWSRIGHAAWVVFRYILEHQELF
ncbi:uncharacterized protein LOC106152957 [Lingula anatina]|uniref:Uncharacterized protein LOC106152957 n=1 Tax=Lingula anatina TaxID=7574 RepID=A0A1S3H9L0_LINAN|nr:uncharacterized protein LOC106152957 [Lingula anatina]|eukprot:XP_013382156.1 uncharacterized protein LOC106152957 [Lingula anatina]